MNNSQYSQSPQYFTLADENRMLEEELKYYQHKNQLLRQQLFGNTSPFNSPISTPSRTPIYTRKTLPSTTSYHSQQPEELDLAIQQINQRKGKEGNYYGNGVNYGSGVNNGSSVNHGSSVNSEGYGMYDSPNQGRKQVRVTQPPGGKSSIIFG